MLVYAIIEKSILVKSMTKMQKPEFLRSFFIKYVLS